MRGEPRRGLVRQSGQPRQSRDRSGPTWRGAGRRIRHAKRSEPTNGFSWSFAGGRHLKGVKDEVKLFRAGRADAEE